MKIKPYDNHRTQNTDIDNIIYELDDPGSWPSIITHNIRMEIIKFGPKRNSCENFPNNNDNSPRRFTQYHYYRIMSNGERIDREWLVYSKLKDSACMICFCCKLFFQNNSTSGLALYGLI